LLDFKVLALLWVCDLEEKAKTSGIAVVRRLIDNGMKGSTVLCVLIGKETFQRQWVDYEIFKAVERGMGIFGIHIHSLGDRYGKKDPKGQNSFSYLGYPIGWGLRSANVSQRCCRRFAKAVSRALF